MEREERTDWWLRLPVVLSLTSQRKNHYSIEVETTLGNRLVPCTFCESSDVEWALTVTGATWPQEMDHIMIRGYEDHECVICSGSGYQGIQEVEVMV